jgi:hypothetical protein
MGRHLNRMYVFKPCLRPPCCSCRW